MPANAAKEISPHSFIVGTSLKSGAILKAIVHALQPGKSAPETLAPVEGPADSKKVAKPKLLIFWKVLF